MSHDPLKTELVLPRLPRLGGEITKSYVDQLVAALEQSLDILNSTRQRNFTEINLTNTQEHGANLRDGTVYIDGGVLKIVTNGDGFAISAFAATFVGTMSVGDVTVSTP